MDMIYRTPYGRLKQKLPLAWLALLVALPLTTTAWPWTRTTHGTASSVVKVYVTQQRGDYAMPWQGVRPERGTGSAFFIGKRRLLTNAHVASDARFLEVSKDADARRYEARVLFIAHDCDLAVLTVDDPDFFETMRPMRFASALPRLNDTVTVLGYPLGGDRLSLTQGVVSRIDYGAYSHSGVDQHLVLQVDAAINPGNSGGPVLFRGEIVGLAFQGLIMADNIGYAIPVPVIRRFLNDIVDGVYNGYPELGIAFLETRNPALRADLKLPPDDRGIVVTRVDPYGAAVGRLRGGDVLLDVDGKPIDSDGFVPLNGNTVPFSELLERKQRGDSITFSVMRSGRAETIRVPLTHPDDPFLFRNLYGKTPRYLIHAGLLFCPLSREYVRTLGRQLGGPNRQQLLYAMEYAKTDGLHEEREALIVLSRILAHPVNTYADGFLDGILDTVNGAHIRNLTDLRDALVSTNDGYHALSFLGMDETLVLDARTSDEASGAILRRYGVPAASSLGDASP